jgi:hypothetical protein
MTSSEKAGTILPTTSIFALVDKFAAETLAILHLLLSLSLSLSLSKT